jgi:hypothetical protein
MSLTSQQQSSLEDKHEERVFNKAYDIYLEYQAILAGQSLMTEEENKSAFEDLCIETGNNIENLWQDCEDNHARSLGC